MAGRKLKVFQAQFGFFDTVVAAASQAAALRAWGTHQNLFAGGEAKITTDEAAVAAATAHPETPLRRAVGSTEPFALEPTSLPEVPDALKKPKATPADKPKVSAPRKPRADRSNLNEAEDDLRRLEDRRKQEEGDIQRQRDKLEKRVQASQAAYVQARKSATAKVVAARAAYRKAGGND